MKVLVVGGSGRVGLELSNLLKKSGKYVVIGCRNPEEKTLPDGITAIPFDLHWDAEKMAAALRGFDAIYFTAGSRGKDLLQVDAFGAVKLMKAAKAVGADRFVMLSSIFAMQPEKWAEEASLASITNYNIAKFFADECLATRSGLDWTIVQASVLKEERGTGRIEVNPKHDGENPIPDVALVLAEVLDRKNTIGKVIMMHSGDTPIETALSEV